MRNHLYSKSIRPFLATIVISLSLGICSAQPSELSGIQLENLMVTSVEAKGRSWQPSFPLLEYEVNGEKRSSAQNSRIVIEVRKESSNEWKGLQYILTFSNTSADTLRLSNVVPFGSEDKLAVITGLGDHYLSRTHLFLPGKQPVNVIVPDNAWELGYAAVKLDNQSNLFGLARRDPESPVNATRRRFETILFPGGSVRYKLYADIYQGNWQEGLREVFQRRYLYDLKSFDDSLYQREDLQWIKKAYVMHLMMAWDKDYFDYKTTMFNWRAFTNKGQKLYGGDDVICLWPTWPSLGLDQRNQFDLYRDLPGGLKKLRELADDLRKSNTRFFIAYNPWDESTRSEGHLKGLASLVESTSADGVVLDTKGESSRELQEAVDAVKPGVIMYSEGMAVPKHMPGIISGRVHNALYYPPMLNLNKLIRPDFAIFRVAEVFREPIIREYATAFFNGYGTEINQFAPGHPSWEDEQYRFLGKTTRILRENSDNFNSFRWDPIVQTLHDSIWVNKWPTNQKTLYTVYNIRADGFKGPLIEVPPPTPGRHYVSIWNHTELSPTGRNGKYYIEVDVASFDRKYLKTNNEGSVDCIADLPEILHTEITGNMLSIDCNAGNEVRIWPGDPAYDMDFLVLGSGSNSLDLSSKFGMYEGKIVIQLFDDDDFLDEVVEYIRPGTPRLISKVAYRDHARGKQDGMVKIPSGKFTFHTTNGDEFIPYPKEDEGRTLRMPSYWMDEFPVTNELYQKFIRATGYAPADTTNYLRHWADGKVPPGKENFPVVYISYEDAGAYAAWARKRLPTEVEWQYAAQTSRLNEWPWKQKTTVTRKEQMITETLTVSNIEGIDSSMCNLGNGHLDPVGSYPEGVNPNGLYDLVGSVWQLTNDTYESGSYRYIILKGGSYFKPSSSWWYVQGGPRELHYRQFLLRVSPGFERNATVGFRCIRD